MTSHTIYSNIFCVFLSVGLLSCSPKLAPTEKENAYENNAPAGRMETDILRYVNEHRRSMGLSSLQTYTTASRQAYEHSKNMATGRTAFGHDGFDGRVETIKKTAGWITASAENVAYGNLSAREVVKGWLNSPGHKKNIEGNYAFTGIGLYKDRKGVIFFTQIFFRK
ncbi:MAG: CAP domain-containing protein [Bacteroidota bacterium]